MISEPNFTIKTLDQTQPRELIQLRWENPCFALVGRFGDAPTLILLERSTSPIYLMPKMADVKVVSYGQDFILEIDQQPEFVDTIDNSYYGVPGALLITPTNRFLCASAAPGIGRHGTLGYDFESGELSSPRSSNGIRFGKWSISLRRHEHDHSGPRVPIFSFSAGQTKDFSR